jgi:thiamine biosynthesis lipoprotein
MTLVVNLRNTLIILLGIFSFSCSSKNNEKPSYLEVRGYAQGTTFSIIYLDSLSKDFSNGFDSILNQIDNQLSTYDSLSFISNFNNSHVKSQRIGSNMLFLKCFNKSKYFNKITNGAFNPALFPLVKYWGFFDNSNEIIDSIYINDSLLPIIKFDSIYIKELDGNLEVNKSNINAKLDFNAIAQGYSVDVVASYLNSQGVENYKVEIGGEVAVRGFNSAGNLWRIGIERPVDSSFTGQYGFQKIISLENKSLATSGSYRKFKMINGKRFSHTIDPLTGYPINNNLLSVTVISDLAIDADAMSTSFMVMGKDSAISFIDKTKDIKIKAYFIYDSLGSFREWSNL